MIDAVYLFLLNHLPAPLTAYSKYPGFEERLQLMVSNSIVTGGLFIFCVVLYLTISEKYRVLALRLFASVALLAPSTLRLLYGYAYDLPVSLLCQAADIAILLILACSVGKAWFRDDTILIKTALGFSLLILFGVAIVAAKINVYFPFPQAFTSIIMAFFAVWIINREYSFNIPAMEWGKTIYALPLIMLLPYLFISGPPDRDTDQFSDMLGYLMQGQPFTNIASGVGNEWFSIRYPAGMVSLGFIVEHALNVRASEAFLLLWVISFVLFIASHLYLSHVLKINKYVVIVLSFNLCFYILIYSGLYTKLFGMTLGIISLAMLIQNRIKPATILIVSATLVHPTSAMVYWAPYFVYVALQFKNAGHGLVSFFRKEPAIFFFLGLLAVYLGSLALGEKIKTHGLVDALGQRNVSVRDFFGNLWNVAEFTVGITAPLMLASIIPLVKKPENRTPYILLVTWLFAVCFLFGITGFSLLGWGFPLLFGVPMMSVYIISCAIIAHLIGDRLPAQSKKWGLLFVVAVWTVIGIPKLRQFPIPSSPFSTHSDVRMGRYIEKHLSKTALIANIRPPQERARWKSLGLAMTAPTVLGDSGRNTVFQHLAPTHQIKNGYLVERRPYMDCLSLPEGKEMFLCFNKLGVTHVFVAARPDTAEFVSTLGMAPEAVIGKSYLFNLLASLPTNPA